MNMLKYEKELKKQGYNVICAIDETGYGSIAGPIYACACCLNIYKAKKIITYFRNKGYKIYDSKRLPNQVIVDLVPKILECSTAIGIGVVNEYEINEDKNLFTSAFRARYRALSNLAYTPQMKHVYWHYQDMNRNYANKFGVKYISKFPHYLLIDGDNSMEVPEVRDILMYKTIILGDRKSISIAAASIIAKRLRDIYMGKCSDVWPQYGFDTNVGYGTKYHKDALKKYGKTVIHRYFVK